jgi:hypothetical protein
MFSEGNAAHLVRCDRPLANSNGNLAHFFKNLNLLGRVWQPDADYNSCLALFKLKKNMRQTVIAICSGLSHPTRHLAEYCSLQRAGGS